MNKLIWTVITLISVIWPVFYPDQFYLNVANMVLLNIIMAVALHLVMRTGYLSLASAAFMGIGAYTSALLTTRWHIPFLAAFICAGFLAAGISYLIGKLLFRLKGVYFVLITFAFGEVVSLFFLNGPSLLGGPNGVVGIPKPEILGFVFGTQMRFYYLALTVTIICVWFIFRVYLKHPGRAYDAINQAEHLAESSGINVTYYKVQAFVISSFITGLAGSLFAHYLSCVTPDAFSFWQSVDLVIMNVLVGTNILAGPIIGAIILVPLPEFFRSAVEYQRALYGLTLVIIIRFLPNGISGLLDRLNLRKGLIARGGKKNT